MAGLRIFLGVFLLALIVYTGVVVARHGPNLLPIFFGDIAAMTWPGQFNFDFFGFLMLSALWTAWRHDFSPLGLGLAVLALFGGMSFLTIYLIVVSLQAKDDVKVVLMGKRRAAG